MALELNDLIKEVLSVPAFGFMGTVNDSNQPVITRIFGFKYDDPLTTLTLYTFKKDAQRVVKPREEPIEGHLHDLHRRRDGSDQRQKGQEGQVEIGQAQPRQRAGLQHVVTQELI